MKWVVLTGAIGLGLVASDVSSAKVLATATRTDAFGVSIDHKWHLIPLTNGDTTSIAFSTPKFRKMIVTYNVSCTVSGNDGTGQLEISVRVDRELPKEWHLLCSEGSHTTNAIRVLEVFPRYQGPGHTVQIMGRGYNTTYWGVYDTFLTVEQ